MKRKSIESEFPASHVSRLTSDAKIRWLCRRGMKELDVLLERFYRAEFAGLDDKARAAFAALLDQEDPDLYDCLFGTPPADPVQARLAERIGQYRRVT